MTPANERGSVLILVLAFVAVLGVIGAGLSRGAHARWAAARDYGRWTCDEVIRKSTTELPGHAAKAIARPAVAAAGAGASGSVIHVTAPGWPEGVTPCDYRERRVVVVVND